jgi:hypothetical protein
VTEGYDVMFKERGGNKAKLQVYVRSREKPDDRMEKVAAAFGSTSGRNPDPMTRSFIGAIREAADTEKRINPDLVGLYFNNEESLSFLSYKKAVEELGCEYEFIDVRTGTLLDFDMNTLNVFPVGNRKIESSEIQLPFPCLKVKDAVLQFNQEYGLTSQTIMEFYVKNS